ncbi:ATP-binding protein [Streptomyces sp. ACA25]|uniref:ATP-binding protein n=1 Tax=Streptomyces sp. ACA25 TaxID=3022596 RepID=UPI0023082E90|nr:ATP-binding protein [Streptomyces sp. ACA25]MDB1088769.1 ATP-binding protein [Streptomyces sp. ACA25]
MSAPRAPSTTPTGTFAQCFAATRRGARLARLLAAHQLAQWGHPRGSEAHDTVVLVVAELTANAVLHGRVVGRDFAFSLSRDESRGVVRIEVTDTHPVRPARLAPGPDEAGGRGLLLVDALATHWGVRDRLGPGKTVWAECALPQAAKPQRR